MDLTIPHGLFDLLKNVTIAVLRERPLDIYEFVADFFIKLRDSRRAGAVGPASPTSSSHITDGDHLAPTMANPSVPLYIVVDDDGLAGEPDPATFRPKVRRQSRNGRRGSVSAERYDPEADTAADCGQWVSYPKTEEQEERLTEAVKDILLFRSLDSDLMKQVIGAMFERKVAPGEHVIRQGDDGDNFYVIESGIFDVIIRRDSDQSQKVLTFDGRGSFGELALMYNMPRAASVLAVTDGTLWAMDRMSFRRIVLNSAFRKRQMYERLLQSVPMLQSLDSYERMTLADALVSRTYDDGQCIIREGDGLADGMFFVELGDVRVTISDDQGEEKVVSRATSGMYFGEMALLENKERSASVYAVGKVKVAFLERECFERLLGPCLDVMKRNTMSYQQKSSF